MRTSPLIGLPNPSTIYSCPYVDHKNLVHVHSGDDVGFLQIVVMGVDVERWVVVPESAVNEVSITNAAEGKVVRSGRCCLSGITNSTVKCFVAVVSAEIGRLVPNIVVVKLGR
jgi:hypothetical protein